MENEDGDPEVSGSIPVGAGVGSVLRIPIPGSGGLAIELRPRGWTPQGGSTSTIFYQDITGKRHLRLDYGFNVKTNTIDYHWNQKSVSAQFGITNHQSAGNVGRGLYNGARYYRYAGRLMLVAGAVIDAYSIVSASKPLQRASEVVAGWAGAWAGCKVVGAGGAWAGGAAGSAAPVVGNAAGAAVGGVGGCIIGGIAGYWIGEKVGATVYEWAEDTVFTPVPLDLSAQQ